MKIVYFSKSFKSAGVAELIYRAHEIGAAGYDLAIRPGYVVHELAFFNALAS